MNESSNSSSELMDEMNSDEERQLLKLQQIPDKLCGTNAHTNNTDIPISLIGSNRENILSDAEYLIYHRPKYTLPPYMDTKVASLSLREKVKITCSYHALISRSIANQAKIQIDSCSYPDPIDPIQKKNFSLVHKKDDSEIEESIETFGSGDRSEEYVSRAGRITKRKFYSEVDERNKDIVASPKGNREDEVSTKRKAPPTPTRNRNLRQKQSKLDSPEADTESIKKSNSKTATPLPISKQQKRSSDGFVEPAAPSSNKRATRKTIECPICGKHFPEKEIEQHASSCGEIAMDVGSTNQSNVNGFHCHSCKKVLYSEEDYEFHCTTCNGGPSYLN